jgi:hypothetical protein
MIGSGAPDFSSIFPPSIGTDELGNITANSTQHEPASLQATSYDTVTFLYPKFSSRERITYTSNQKSFQDEGI